MSHIEETNRELEQHMEQTKTRDVISAVIVGFVLGLAVWFLLGTGGPSSSGGISPTITQRDAWPVLGGLTGLLGGAFTARAFYGYRRQQRRRRFWGL